MDAKLHLAQPMYIRLSVGTATFRSSNTFASSNGMPYQRCILQTLNHLLAVWQTKMAFTNMGEMFICLEK